MANGATGGTIGDHRIARIRIRDFRAFPAHHPADIRIGGKNLLVFGENGAGKSSIYRALRELLRGKAVPISEYRNRFSNPMASSVEVDFVEGPGVVWHGAGHPTEIVRSIADRAGFLTYKQLFEMNRGESRDVAANLFKLAVDKLLADYMVILPGGRRRTIRELWEDVQKAVAARGQTKRGTQRLPGYTARVQAACDDFNQGMAQALELLSTSARGLLRRLLDVLSPDPLELEDLYFPRIAFVEKGKDSYIDNQVLTPLVKVNGLRIEAPQTFLNEARQSALAIAIYLAARRTCVPEQSSGLKLLVLDDLLISLDHSHRRPVLQTIMTEFVDWQIVLMTHDRFWFDLAWEQVEKEKGDWAAIEVYEERDGNGTLTPLVRPLPGGRIETLLDQARDFLAEHHPAAAANYARSACELVLRRFCKKQGIKFVLQEDGDHLKLDELLKAVLEHVKADAVRKAVVEAVLQHKRFVLNPYSHGTSPALPESEVAAAIAAVEELKKSCSKQYQPPAAPPAAKKGKAPRKPPKGGAGPIVVPVDRPPPTPAAPEAALATSEPPPAE